MGGVGHERLVRLWTETAIVQTPRGTTHYSDGTVPKDVTPTITRLTPQQVWGDIRDQEGYESGHSYSGNFAVKPGFIAFGTADVDKDVLAAAGDIVSQLDYDDEALRKRTDAYCGWRDGWQWGAPYCDKGKTKQTRTATLDDGTLAEVTVTVDCPQCKGTGRRPLTEDEQKAEDERFALVQKALAAFGEATLRRAAAQYSQKWDEAAALIGRDHVWFGGVCSS